MKIGKVTIIFQIVGAMMSISTMGTADTTYSTTRAYIYGEGNTIRTMARDAGDSGIVQLTDEHTLVSKVGFTVYGQLIPTCWAMRSGKTVPLTAWYGLTWPTAPPGYGRT